MRKSDDNKNATFPNAVFFLCFRPTITFQGWSPVDPLFEPPVLTRPLTYYFLSSFRRLRDPKKKHFDNVRAIRANLFKAVVRNFLGAANGGQQKEFDHFFAFSGLFRSLFGHFF